MSENRKVRYTKMVIRQSLYELLETKPLSQITIKELVEVADINRSTFYAHYETLPALIEEIELENAQKIIDAMAVDTYSESDYKTRVIGDFVRTITEDKELAFWFLDEQVVGTGRRRILDYAQEQFISFWIENGKVDRDIAEYAFAYIYNGSIGMLKKWYEDPDGTSLDTLKKSFSLMTENSLSQVH